MRDPTPEHGQGEENQAPATEGDKTTVALEIEPPPATEGGKTTVTLEIEPPPATEWGKTTVATEIERVLVTEEIEPPPATEDPPDDIDPTPPPGVIPRMVRPFRKRNQ